MFQVFCDFDGTISLADTVDELLERLALPAWQDIEARWEEGEIGSRECMAQQVKLIQGGWPAIESCLHHIKLDSTFKPFSQWCKQVGISLTVVSDGIDRVIETLLKREGIHVDGILANHLVENHDNTLSLEFPHAATKTPCLSGMCKCQVLENHGGKLIKVVIGDGVSDYCWSENADMVFAKGKLKTHCEEKQIPYTPFSRFETIQAVLEASMILKSGQPRVNPEERTYAA